MRLFLHSIDGEGVGDAYKEPSQGRQHTYRYVTGAVNLLIDWEPQRSLLTKALGNQVSVADSQNRCQQQQTIRLRLYPLPQRHRHRKTRNAQSL